MKPPEKVSPSIIIVLVIDKLKTYVQGENGPALNENSGDDYLVKSKTKLGDINGHNELLAFKNQKSADRRDNMRQSFDIHRLKGGIKPKQVKVADEVED